MVKLPFRIPEEKEERRPAALQEEMTNIIRELRQAEELFNNVTDDALTEACIYRIRHLISYRDYLIRTAREEAPCGDAAVTIG